MLDPDTLQLLVPTSSGDRSSLSYVPTKNSSSGCFHHAIGVEDPTIIPDNQMTASSYYSKKYYPYYGRLHHTRGDGWSAKKSKNPSDWLQVDFGRTSLVCAVATQGDTDGDEWVIDFSLSFSLDETSWEYSKDPDGNKKASLDFLDSYFDLNTKAQQE